MLSGYTKKMRSRIKSISSSGFMLIEVLASVILTLAFISVFFPFTSQLLIFWNSGRSELDKIDVLMTGTVRLMQDFSTAFPFLEPSADQAKLQNLFFYGTKNTILFVRVATEGGIYPQLEEVGFEITESPQGVSLIRRHILLNGTLPKKEIAELENPTSIISDKKYINITFFKHNGDKKEEWSSDVEMPKKILLTLSDDKPMGDRKIWLDILSDSPGNCLVSGNC